LALAAGFETPQERTNMSTVEIERDTSGAARLIIDRTHKGNALDRATAQALTEAAVDLAGDAALRVVVLMSKGERAFSAGADLNDLALLDATTARGFISGLHRAIGAVRAIPVPVICRIQGACIGGAMELAAGCDLRIASERASFSMPEVRVGIPSVIEAALLPRLMGRGRAGWLVLSGETIDARTAQQWGFVEKLIDADDLDHAVEAAVDAVLAADPAAVRLQKRLLADWDRLSLDDAIAASIDAFAAAFETGDPSTRMRDILAKRRKS